MGGLLNDWRWKLGISPHLRAEHVLVPVYFQQLSFPAAASLAKLSGWDFRKPTVFAADAGDIENPASVP